MTQIALIDDHKIFCDSLASLINDFDGFTVSWTAQNGGRAIELRAAVWSLTNGKTMIMPFHFILNKVSSN